MKVEFPNLCKDCEHGKIILGRHVQFNISNTEGRIPIGFSKPPRVERNCINFVESLLKKREKIFNLYSSCDKPELYISKNTDPETE
ncbi:hypothetical protein ACFL15_00655 [Patescibacteria group bacterium]